MRKRVVHPVLLPPGSLSVRTIGIVVRTNSENLALADLDAVFQAGNHFRPMTPEVTWRASDAAPMLLAALQQKEPGLSSVLARMESGLPVQKTWAFGEAGAFVRPDRHARAIYLDLSKLNGRPHGGCIAIKGSEPACDNFSDIVERLKHMWNVCGVTMGGFNRTIYQEVVMMNSMDRFPVTESVPPGVHLHASAMEEAEIGAEYQGAYLQRYSALAKAPVPLLVFRWPDDVADRVRERLAPDLAPRSRKIVDLVLNDGLGVFVYYYRSIPLRVIHLQAPDAVDATSLDRRLEVLGGVKTANTTIESWVEETARMLVLGYVPTDPTSLDLGYCIQPQNLIVDGGFADISSLRPISSFMKEGEFRYALLRTLQVLERSISWFLVGSQAGPDAFRRHFPEVYCSLWEKVREHVRTEIENGTAVHEWLANAVRRDDLASSLLGQFRVLLDLAEYVPGDQEDEAYTVTSSEA